MDGKINQVRTATHGSSLLPGKNIDKREGKELWVEKNVYFRMLENDVPRNANIFGSHATYRRKSDGSAKARITAWGHRDTEMSVSRGGTPSLKLDSMRLFLSLTAENRWIVRKMGIKSTYLQTGGFFRDIFVCPPSKRTMLMDCWSCQSPRMALQNPDDFVAAPPMKRLPNVSISNMRSFSPHCISAELTTMCYC